MDLILFGLGLATGVVLTGLVMRALLTNRGSRRLPAAAPEPPPDSAPSVGGYQTASLSDSDPAATINCSLCGNMPATPPKIALESAVTLYDRFNLEFRIMSCRQCGQPWLEHYYEIPYWDGDDMVFTRWVPLTESELTELTAAAAAGVDTPTYTDVFRRRAHLLEGPPGTAAWMKPEGR